MAPTGNRDACPSSGAQAWVMSRRQVEVWRARGPRLRGPDKRPGRGPQIARRWWTLRPSAHASARESGRDFVRLWTFQNANRKPAFLVPLPGLQNRVIREDSHIGIRVAL